MRDQTEHRNVARERARIVAETIEPGVSVCAVARRHGIAQGLLFTWRRQARGKAGRIGTGATLRSGRDATGTAAQYSSSDCFTWTVRKTFRAVLPTGAKSLKY